jgi:hypothetical protein
LGRCGAKPRLKGVWPRPFGLGPGGRLSPNRSAPSRFKQSADLIVLKRRPPFSGNASISALRRFKSRREMIFSGDRDSRLRHSAHRSPIRVDSLAWKKFIFAPTSTKLRRTRQSAHSFAQSPYFCDSKSLSANSLRGHCNPSQARPCGRAMASCPRLRPKSAMRLLASVANARPPAGLPRPTKMETGMPVPHRKAIGRQGPMVEPCDGLRRRTFRPVCAVLMRGATAPPKTKCVLSYLASIHTTNANARCWQAICGARVG